MEIVQEAPSNRAALIAQRCPPTTENEDGSPPDRAETRSASLAAGALVEHRDGLRRETEPAETEPKSRTVTAGENTSTGTAAAVPVAAQVVACGEPAALLITVSAPVQALSVGRRRTR